MKKVLFPFYVLMMLLILSACGSNVNDTTSTSQGDDQSNTKEDDFQTPTGELVMFPEDYDKEVLYTTVTRGSTYEELYTSREAIEAVQNNQPIPSGTVITLAIYNDDELDRYVVMEKRDGWGAQYSPEIRNGEWEYQAFTAEGEIDHEQDIGSCFSCHANQKQNDYVNTFDEMKDYDLDNLTGLNENSNESQLVGTSTKDWEVKGSQIGDEEEEQIIQKVLLMTYFNEFNN